MNLSLARLLERWRSPQRATILYSPLPTTNGDSNKGPERVFVEEPPSRLTVLASVLFYMVAALTMVMVNKTMFAQLLELTYEQEWVLNVVDTPLLFLWVQLATAVVLLHVTAFAGFFTVPTVDFHTCSNLLPLVALNGIGLTMNTFCLRYVDASFYQVARGLILPWTVMLSYFILDARPSRSILSTIAVVCFGFAVGVASEHLRLNVTSLGILLGATSSLASAGHAIFVKRCLPFVNNSTLNMAYFSNLLSACALFPFVIIFETSGFVNMVTQGGTTLKTFLIGGLVTGFFGFMICIAGYVSIKVTSPVTHMISSAVRGVLQTFLGVWLFGDILSFGRISSIALTLTGSVLYTWIRDKEIRLVPSSTLEAIRLDSSTSNRDPQEPDEADATQEDVESEVDRFLAEEDKESGERVW